MIIPPSTSRQTLNQILAHFCVIAPHAPRSILCLFRHARAPHESTLMSSLFGVLASAHLNISPLSRSLGHHAILLKTSHAWDGYVARARTIRHAQRACEGKHTHSLEVGINTHNARYGTVWSNISLRTFHHPSSDRWFQISREEGRIGCRKSASKCEGSSYKAIVRNGMIKLFPCLLD